MAKDFQQVRQEILAMHARIKEENHYELLGVAPDADNAMISNRFRQLAREWHVDRFSQFDLGADKVKVQEIFSAINTAHKTLTNQDARADYDLEIDDGPDIASILEAESSFRRGKSMLNSGRYDGAFESFKAAYETKNDEAEYHAYFVYTEFLTMPKDDDGVVRNKKRGKEIFDVLDDINEALQEKDWLLAMLGTVAMGMGREREAEECFNEALMANPNNTDAKRMIRLIRSRRRKGKKGFFAKLLGK